MEALEINKLIEAAEDVIDHGLIQGHIYLAAESRKTVQIFVGADGKQYRLALVLRPYQEGKMTLYTGG